MKNSIITIIYSHGRFGSPWYGSKIELLRPVALTLGVNMISIRYPETISVMEMEKKLLDTVKDDVNVPGDLVFLSSSRGAYISTRIAQKVIDYYDQEDVRMDDDKILPKRHVLGQFLIAPAFGINPDYYPDQEPTPANIRTTIIHGLDDDLISCDNSINFSKKFGSQLYLIEGDHRLKSQEEKLCLLLEIFLNECINQSNSLFNKWQKK
jgi:hypothetical protein